VSGSRPVWMATRRERSRTATEESETVGIAGRDRGNGCTRWGDDGGGSGAEGFGKLSGGVSGENFVDGDLALFGRNADLAKQSQSGVACDAGKDRARESGVIALPSRTKNTFITPDSST